MAISGTMSRFTSAASVKESFGLSHPRLMELVAQGAVRSIKFGAAKQAGRLYNTADIERALEQMSVGKKPKLVVSANQNGGE